MSLMLALGLPLSSSSLLASRSPLALRTRDRSAGEDEVNGENGDRTKGARHDKKRRVESNEAI